MKTLTKIKAGFNGVAGKISSNDRLDAAKELGVHPATIDRYLRGDIRKESFGLDLLSFLKKRVEDREKVLND